MNAMSCRSLVLRKVFEQVESTSESEKKIDVTTIHAYYASEQNVAQDRVGRRSDLIVF